MTRQCSSCGVEEEPCPTASRYAGKHVSHQFDPERRSAVAVNTSEIHTREDEVALLERRIEESGLKTGPFAREVLLREARTVRRWLSGAPIPKRVLEWLQEPQVAPWPRERDGWALELSQAAIAYYEAIQRHSSKGESWVGGDDLDGLYEAWIRLAREGAPPG